jgi:phage recombination protein Bet
MTNEVATTQQDAGSLVAVMQNSLYPGASKGSVELVLDYCRAAKLDPLQKPVHIVPMWDRASNSMRDVIMPGVGLYRTQAARSGQLAGISEPEFGPMVEFDLDRTKINVPEWCRVVVKRQMANGAIAEFAAVEYWIENYAVKGGKEKSIAPNTMWQKRPRGQIAKCAQAQALRIAFPEMTGSAPTADEMEGKTFDIGEVDITPKQEVNAEVKKPEFLASEKFDANKETWRKLIETKKKTIDTLIVFLDSKAPLTESQKSEIKSWESPVIDDVVDADFDDTYVPE